MSVSAEEFAASSAASLCNHMMSNADEITSECIRDGMYSCTQCAKQYGICSVPMEKSDQTGEFTIESDGWFSLRHKDGRMWYKGMAYDSMVLGFNMERTWSNKDHCMLKPTPSMLVHLLLSSIVLVADYFLPLYLGWSKLFSNLTVLGGAFIVGFTTFYFFSSLSDGEFINPYLTFVLHLLAWSPVIVWQLFHGQLYVWIAFLSIAFLSFILWRQRKWVLFGTIQIADIYLLRQLVHLIPQVTDHAQHRLLLMIALSLTVGFFSTFISIRTSFSTWRFDDWSPLLLNLSGFAITFVLLLCYHSISFFYHLSDLYGDIAVLTFIMIVLMLVIATWKKLIDYGWFDSFMGVGNDANVLCMCMVLIPGFYIDCLAVILMDWELWIGLLYTLGLTIACLFLGWSVCDTFHLYSDMACSISVSIFHLAIAGIVVYVESLMWKLISLGFIVGCGLLSCLCLCCCSN